MLQKDNKDKTFQDYLSELDEKLGDNIDIDNYETKVFAALKGLYYNNSDSATEWLMKQHGMSMQQAVAVSMRAMLWVLSLTLSTEYTKETAKGSDEFVPYEFTAEQGLGAIEAAEKAMIEHYNKLVEEKRNG